MAGSITFTIKKAPPGQPGKVEAEVNGERGPACVQNLQPFLDILGMKDQAIVQKPEYQDATVAAERG